jgi:hypothetical protein
MSGYVSSWIEQYTQTPTTTCATTQSTNPEISNCLLWVLVGVVFLSLKFQKKRVTK